MGLPKNEPKSLFTIDQYLAMERSSEECHEFVDGEVIAMSVESHNHGDVSANIAGFLHAQLIGTKCKVKIKETRIRSGPKPDANNRTKGMFSCPDVFVVCEPIEFHDRHRDVILNPKVIFEVLSPSTEGFDRGEKFRRYSDWNPSLIDYILVSQDEMYLEHFTRESNGKWSLMRYSGNAAVIELPSLHCRLQLSDIYDRVEFSTPEE